MLNSGMRNAINFRFQTGIYVHRTRVRSADGRLCAIYVVATWHISVCSSKCDELNATIGEQIGLLGPPLGPLLGPLLGLLLGTLLPQSN